MTRISNPQDCQPQSESKMASNGKTILLAEDDPFISRMYIIKLEGAGYKVQLANNGRDAYDLIKSVKPDLILLDINMPELTGFEVVKALVSDHEKELISRITVLTNSANPADRKMASDLGIDYVVKADLTPHDVLDRINTKLGVK
jgi:CheY-like chemotaxis protein